eukprot:1161615-Pelagomonas_calceolata.AAC.3
MHACPRSKQHPRVSRPADKLKSRLAMIHTFETAGTTWPFAYLPGVQARSSKHRALRRGRNGNQAAWVGQPPVGGRGAAHELRCGFIAKQTNGHHSLNRHMRLLPVHAGGLIALCHHGLGKLPDTGVGPGMETHLEQRGILQMCAVRKMPLLKILVHFVAQDDTTCLATLVSPLPCAPSHLGRCTLLLRTWNVEAHHMTGSHHRRN